MTGEEMTKLDGLRSTARAWQNILGGPRDATHRGLQSSLTELWVALEILATITADRDLPHVVLGLTGSAGKPADGNGGSAGPQDPANGTGGSTGLREDFLEL